MKFYLSILILSYFVLLRDDRPPATASLFCVSAPSSLSLRWIKHTCRNMKRVLKRVFFRPADEHHRDASVFVRQTSRLLCNGRRHVAGPWTPLFEQGWAWNWAVFPGILRHGRSRVVLFNQGPPIHSTRASHSTAEQKRLGHIHALILFHSCGPMARTKSLSWKNGHPCTHAKLYSDSFTSNSTACWYIYIYGRICGILATWKLWLSSRAS